jgi:type I restriction enzyme S subunit
MMVFKLAKICEFVSGGTPGRNVAEYFMGDIPWITGADIIDDRVQSPRYYITEKAVQESATNIVPAGNILLVTRTGVGKVAITEQDICISQDFTGLIIDSKKIDKKYLYHYLRSRRDYFLSNQRGATIKGVTRNVVENLEVPIPSPDDPARSLAEQRRIVARLELLLDETRAMREDIQIMRRDLAQVMESVLAEVFPNPNEEMPEGWDVQEVRTISEPPQYGYTQSATTENTGTKFLRITDIQNGNVEWDEVPYCQIDDNNFDKYALFDGDIVFARSGATTGKTFLLKNPPRAVFASYLIRLRIRGIFPDFVYWFFQSSHYWNQVRLRGGAQPNMNANLLSQILVPIPKSLSEQRRIVAYLEHIAEEIRAMDDGLAQDLRDIEALNQTILAAAFRGEG